MNVFVAGATGVVGQRAVVALLATGAGVTAMARSPRKWAELQRLGATPVAVDLFDRAALATAVAGHDVVCNLATAIPTGPEAAEPAAWAVTDRIRREGARNLVDAALAVGAARYVQESIVLLYADGGAALLDETAPIAASGTASSAVDAEASAARFAEHGGAGVVLRFGQFYGHDSGHTVAAIGAVRAGAPGELGDAAAYRSVITTDDAATAVVAALRAPSGVYNVVDDEALSRAANVAALADALGVPVPVPPSATPDLPPHLAAMLRSQRVSNARFKAATGWAPRFPSAREGWRHVVRGWLDHLADGGATS